MFDSHCHPTDTDDAWDVVQQAYRAGVALLCCGYNADANEQVRRLRARWCTLPIALGLHPWFASEAIEPVLELIEHERPTAIGEVGLDLSGEVDERALARQREVLEAQLDLAARLELPVTAHSRRAAPALLEVARNHSRVRGALHAYGGSFEQLVPFLRLGWFVGVGGAVTRPNARRVRRCASRVPLDRVLLETDSPAIGMHGLESNQVRPVHVRRVAESLAELRGVEVESLVAQTDSNARELFGRDVTELGDLDSWTTP
ncbi:MAG: TatD family hydrolase [Polyangiaceae bacterium]|nr:TatD family hydrolase [Polyangiaceae bacterium]